MLRRTTMTGIRNFIADNWYQLALTVVLVAGAIYELGFRARDIQALHDFSAETRATQIKRISELEATRADVERLKWELASYAKAIDEVKMDVKQTSRSVQELEKRMEVVIELLLKPKVRE